MADGRQIHLLAERGLSKKLWEGDWKQLMELDVKSLFKRRGFGELN